MLQGLVTRHGNSRRRLFAILFVASSVQVGFASLAAAPQVISYQGVLTLTDGTPVADGPYDLVFEIYNDPFAGTPIFTSPTIQAEVKAGIFNVLLSAPETGLPLSEVFADNVNTYMQVNVLAGDPAAPFPLLPRQQIASVPYSLGTGSALPTGAIILWDMTDTCPSGFTEEQSFRGRLAVGADLGQTDDDIADTVLAPPGGVSDPAQPTPWHTGTTASATQRKGTSAQPLTAAHSAHSHHFVPPHKTVLFCRKS